MNVIDPELVLVRGITDEWVKENFGQLLIYFGGSSPQTVPKEDAYYVGLYSVAPISKITHIGIVQDIHRYANGVAEFYLKALIALKTPIDPGHGIRKHENWTLAQLGLSRTQMERIKNELNAI